MYRLVLSYGVYRCIFLWLLLGVLLSTGMAQPREIRLSLGFGGQMVAEQWNPLRLTLRDQPAAELLLRMDVGSLREGERWLEYRAPLAGGSGLVVFDDVVWMPRWRALVWRVQTSGAQPVVLASGSLSPRNLVADKLELIVSNISDVPAAALLALLGGEATTAEQGRRLVTLQAQQLPKRAAAYSGVARMVVAEDGLEPTALFLAAVAGVQVGVTNPALARKLAATRPRRLGAGWLFPLRSPEDWPPPAALLDVDAITQAAWDAMDDPSPTHVSTSSLLVFLLAYVAIVAALLQWGQAAGATAALLLALACALGVAGWLGGRLEPTLQSHSLAIDAGGLRYQQDFIQLTSPRRAQLRLAAGVAPRRPAEIPQGVQWRWQPDATVLGLEPATRLQAHGPPQLHPVPSIAQRGARQLTSAQQGVSISLIP